MKPTAHRYTLVEVPITMGTVRIRNRKQRRRVVKKFKRMGCETFLNFKTTTRTTYPPSDWSGEIYK